MDWQNHSLTDTIAESKRPDPFIFNRGQTSSRYFGLCEQSQQPRAFHRTSDGTRRCMENQKYERTYSFSEYLQTDRAIRLSGQWTRATEIESSLQLGVIELRTTLELHELRQSPVHETRSLVQIVIEASANDFPGDTFRSV